MAATITSLTPLSGDLYLLTWSGATTPYRVVRNGLVITTTDDTQATLSAEAGDVLDVLEPSDPIPEGYPPKATVTFWGVTGAESYQVEEYVGGAWVLRATFPAGKSFYSYTTRQLEDITTHQFRVLALDTAGNSSTADQIDFFFVRYPDVPTFSASYTNPTLTITAT